VRSRNTTVPTWSIPNDLTLEPGHEPEPANFALGTTRSSYESQSTSKLVTFQRQDRETKTVTTPPRRNQKSKTWSIPTGRQQVGRRGSCTVLGVVGCRWKLPGGGWWDCDSEIRTSRPECRMRRFGLRPATAVRVVGIDQVGTVVLRSSHRCFHGPVASLRLNDQVGC